MVGELQEEKSACVESIGRGSRRKGREDAEEEEEVEHEGK